MCIAPPPVSGKAWSREVWKFSLFEKRRRKRLHVWKCMLGKVKAEKSVVGVCCWLFGFNYQQYYCLCRIVTCFPAHYCMYQSSIIVWVGDQAQYCISTQYYCLHWQLGTISCRAAQYYSSLHVTLLAILFTALENTQRKPLFKFSLCICSAVRWHDFVSSCKLFCFVIPLWGFFLFSTHSLLLHCSYFHYIKRVVDKKTKQ